MATFKSKDGKEVEAFEKGSVSSVRLKRELGLFSAVNMIVGVMIGSGIFISPTSALFHTGSVAFCIIVWILCGIISLMGALAFAELGTVVPRSGAEYAYFQEAFGPLHRFWGPLPSFICSWIYIMILKPAEVAVLVLTFAEYTIVPLGVLFDYAQMSADHQDMLKKLVGMLTLGLITVINISSVKLYVKLQNIFATCKVFACVVVIIGGIYELSIGNFSNLEKGFEGSKTGPGSIALAFYSGLWAYDGWTAVTTVTEEIQNPSVPLTDGLVRNYILSVLQISALLFHILHTVKNIPKSIIIAVPTITALYVFMNIAYMTVLSVPEMMASSAVAMSFGEKALGPFVYLIPVGVAIATFGCALSLQFGVTRLCYVAGKDGHTIEVFSFVHMRRFTPAAAVAFQGLVAFLFIIVGNIHQLIDFASFLIWIFYGGAMVALLVMRRTHADVPRPYKVPLIVPYFVLAVAIFLSVVPIVGDPSVKYLFAIAFILLGVAVYTYFIYYKKRPRVMDTITRGTQALFEVVPPSTHSE